MKEVFEKIVEQLEEPQFNIGCGACPIKEKCDEVQEAIDDEMTDLCAETMRVIAKEIVQDVAEEYNNGWIACSDRLPVAKEKRFGNKQKRTDVLVTLRNGVVKEMTYEFATKKFWEAGDENPIEHWKEDYNGNDIEVIAWQSLPEPYELT